MKTATSSLAQQMYTIHKPDLWIFGHHHKSFDETIGGTRFICLNELESKVFDL
jgi:predicted phosphodiesterase